MDYIEGGLAKLNFSYDDYFCFFIECDIQMIFLNYSSQVRSYPNSNFKTSLWHYFFSLCTLETLGVTSGAADGPPNTAGPSQAPDWSACLRVNLTKHP